MTFTRIRGWRTVVAATIAVVAMLGALWSPSAAIATTSSSDRGE